MATGGSAFKDDLRKDGYSKEEKYFHDLNREVIDAYIDAHIDATRAKLNARQPNGPTDASNTNELPTPAFHPASGARRTLAHWLHKIFGAREGSQDLF